MPSKHTNKPIILKVCTTQELKDKFKKKYGDKYMSKRVNALMRADINDDLIITYKKKP